MHTRSIGRRVRLSRPEPDILWAAISDVKAWRHRKLRPSMRGPLRTAAHQRLIQLRIERAKNLLARTSLTIERHLASVLHDVVTHHARTNGLTPSRTSCNKAGENPAFDKLTKLEAKNRLRRRST